VTDTALFLDSTQEVIENKAMGILCSEEPSLPPTNPAQKTAFL
jgi:hypothetical protein